MYWPPHGIEGSSPGQRALGWEGKGISTPEVFRVGQQLEPLAALGLHPFPMYQEEPLAGMARSGP